MSTDAVPPTTPAPAAAPAVAPAAARLTALATCVINTSQSLQLELQLTSSAHFELATVLRQYVNQLDSLLFTVPNAILANGYQTGEYQDLIFTIAGWVLEVLVKRPVPSIATTPENASKIARAILVQMLMTGQPLLELPAEEREAVLIRIGMDGFLSNVSLLLYPLANTLSSQLVSCCLGFGRPAPNVNKNTAAIQLGANILLQHSRTSAAI